MTTTVDVAKVNKLNFSAKVIGLKEGLSAAIIIATVGSLKDHIGENLVKISSSKNDFVASAFGGRLSCEVAISNTSQDQLDYKGVSEGNVVVNATDLQKCLESFPNDERVMFVSDGNELTICREKDEEEKQVLPAIKETVTLPELAKDFDKEVKINRLVFLDGIEQTFWGIGIEEHKELYMYERMVFTSKSATFYAGTGSRFSVLKIEGDKFVSVKEKTEIYLHKGHVPGLVNIISKVKDDCILIKQASRKDNVPEQIVIELDSLKIQVVGIDTTMKWPNVEKAIEEKKAYSIKTKVSDWEFTTKGLLATFNEETRKQHDLSESSIEAKLDKGYILFNAQTTMKSQRKIPILDPVSKGAKTEGLSFNCSTTYIGEVYSRSADKKNANIFVQYHEDENKPIFIITEKIDDASLGISKQQTIFFASSKK